MCVTYYFLHLFIYFIPSTARIKQHLCSHVCADFFLSVSEHLLCYHPPPPTLVKLVARTAAAAAAVVHSLIEFPPGLEIYV